jgi:murein DD-endopeptidase MepM/ murein hydrolase activator NlpD
VASYRLTGTFGEASSLWSSTHTGLDFATTEGSPIHAVAGGVVTAAGWEGSYGYRTIVTLPDGTEIWYAHQSRILVREGEEVTRDEEIGEVGSTGNSTGPHVHLEVRPHGGDPVDPQVALPEHGVTP